MEDACTRRNMEKKICFHLTIYRILLKFKLKNKYIFCIISYDINKQWLSVFAFLEGHVQFTMVPIKDLYNQE